MPKTNIGLQVEADLLPVLDKLAEENGRSRSAQIRHMIAAQLALTEAAKQTAKKMIAFHETFGGYDEWYKSIGAIPALNEDKTASAE